MSKNQERKNFPTKIIEEVFEEQGRQCAKCGRSLYGGFHAHHKDGDNTNIEKENCQLLCAGCHGGEMHKTLQEQKKAVIGDLDGLIKVGLDGKASGATIEKMLDTIKLKLSLQRQVMDDPPLEVPASIKAETYATVMEHGLREYENGFKVGLERMFENFVGMVDTFPNLLKKSPTIKDPKTVKKDS
jgi:hypothetical protein